MSHFQSAASHPSVSTALEKRLVHVHTLTPLILNRVCVDQIRADFVPAPGSYRLIRAVLLLFILR